MSFLQKIIRNSLSINTSCQKVHRHLSYLKISNRYTENLKCTCILQNNNLKPNIKFLRYKYSKKDGKQNKREEEDDDDDDSSQFGLSKDPNVIKVSVNSLRTDLLLKAALGIARKYDSITFTIEPH